MYVKSLNIIIIFVDKGGLLQGYQLKSSPPVAILKTGSCRSTNMTDNTCNFIVSMKPRYVRNNKLIFNE